MAYPSKITPEMVNFSRLAMCIIGPGTNMMRDILSLKVQPSSLRNLVLYANLKLNNEQKKQLNEGTEPDYKNFDISFIYLLLRTPGMCRPPIPVPTNRWGTPPSTKYQVTLGDDIERLRILKNHICSHIKKPELSKQEFDDKISELKDIAQRIDTFLAPSSAYFTEVCAMETENMESEVCYYFLEEIKKLQKHNQNVTKKISSLAEKTDQIRSKLDRTTQETENVSREITAQKKKTDQISSKQDRTTQEMENVSLEITAQKKKTDQISSKLDRTTQEMQNVSREITAQKKKTDQISCKLDRTTQETENVSREITAQKKKTDQMNNKLDRMTQEMENFSSEITAQKLQEKAFIKQISQEDELFVETNSFKKILSLIDREKVISVIGNTGQGKTALSRHAAIYLYNKGYKIFNIRSADEFKRKFNPEIRALYLMDDIFGKHYKIQHEVDSWSRMDDEVTNWLKESDIYLISTSQKIVWNECQPYIKTCELFQKENILDLTLEELHPLEKRGILIKHLLAHNRIISERLLQKIIQIETPIGFPFCCSSFSSNDELYALEHEYFLNTKASLKKEFERLSEINIEKFCALLSVMVLGNSLPDSFENIFKTAVGDKVSSVLLPYGIELNKNIVKLNRALTDLKGVYLQEHNHKVSFTHDAYIDAMCMVVNKSNIDVILRNCTADFFHQYIRISEELGQTDNDTPTFLTDPDEDLFNCIFRLLKSGELHLVFENPMFGNENFMNRFTKQVCKEPELFGLIACPLENDNDKPSVLEYCFEANTKPLLEFALSCFKKFKRFSNIFQDTLTICLNECLCIASKHGLTEAVEQLLENGANIVYKSQKSHNLDPFLWSAAYARVETLTLLKQRGANVNSVDSKGRTAFDCFIHYLSPDKTQKVNLKDESTLNQLMRKTEMKELLYLFPEETMKNFSIQKIKELFPGNYVFCDGKTILHFISEMNISNKSYSKWFSLLKMYIFEDVNIQDRKGKTPIIYAAEKANPHVLSILCRALGADVNITDHEGKTALHHLMIIWNKGPQQTEFNHHLQFEISNLCYELHVGEMDLRCLPFHHMCSLSCFILLEKNAKIVVDGETKDPKEYLCSFEKQELFTFISNEVQKRFFIPF